MGYDMQNIDLLHEDDFGGGFDRWHHEGIGEIRAAPDGGMRLHCKGSRQGGEGCMAFFRPTLPDQVAIEYELTVRSRGGLVINYIAIRGENGEDLIEDAGKLEPRTGVMRNYFATKWGLQSYHVSVSRFDDAGEHTGTSNWRRNPGCRLVAHGWDAVTEMDRPFCIRVGKDKGHCYLMVDGVTRFGFIDHDSSRPIPDWGKFGFRLIGSDVMADVQRFRVYRTEPLAVAWSDGSNEQ